MRTVRHSRRCVLLTCALLRKARNVENGQKIWAIPLAIVNYHNFGCSTQSNIAAMVSNPADLLGPRSMTPSSADRRDTVYDKYVKGQPTATVAHRR